MPVIRIVLLLSLVGGLTLFAFSNLSPVLPLVFLGVTTPAQPLATWIGGAFAAGVVTSFFLQLLNTLVRDYSPRRVADRRDIPPRSRSFARETPEPEPNQTRYTPPPPPEPPPERRDASDWEEDVGEDWDFDEPAAAPSVSQANRQYRSTPPSDRTNYEAPQEPKSGSQTGSVYSYSYRDEKDSGVGKADTVYDANYRVITPPYQKPAEVEDDEEDWGFEDDEEFDDDERPRRR